MNQESLNSVLEPAKELIDIWKTQISSNPFAWKNFFDVSSESHQAIFFKWFEGLDLAEQERVVRGTMGATVNLPFEDLTKEQEFNFLKKFLFRYRLRPLADDVYEKISEDDFIEVYDAQGIQIYRSWNFFKFCRYTIDQVLSKSWGELYERPEFVHKKLMALMPILFQGQNALIDYHIEEFLLSERYIHPRAHYMVKMKFACPLVDMQSGQVVAFISVARARKIDAPN